MHRFKPKVPWNPNRIPPIDRIFQSILGVILLGVIYRYCWIDIADPYKCSALLNTGGWLDDGPKWSSRNPFQNWQPDGCIIHEYKKADIRECLVNRRVVFIGDSTTRQIFWAVAKKLEPQRAEDVVSELVDMETKHKDIEFSSGGVTVEFKWDPWLNSSALDQELDKFSVRPAGEDAFDESAAIILLGAPGLWYARHGQENYFKDFRDSIDRVIPYMDHSTENSAGSRPVPFGKQSPNFLLLAPVQDPWYQALSPSREETITPQKIDQMNDLLQQVSAHSHADVVWSYSLMTWAGRAAYEGSGLHVIDNIAHRKADVLLNLRCNAQSAAKGYPFNRTCCNNYTPPGAVQWMILLTGMVILPGIFFLRRKRPGRVTRFLPSTEVLIAFWTICLVVCFCFYADRTQIFEKSHKQYRKREFKLALQVVTVAGLLSIRKAKPTKSKTLSPPDAGFLSRDQTDEWKGWMQFFILIYHYTHASKTLWIYEVVRLLVASYLFMIGFGHTRYFLSKADYSFKRVASVLLRLNLLSCVLPYMMRTDYLFYYFAPLASFWFLIIYLTLRIQHERNTDLAFVFQKLLLSAALTTAFITIPGILEVVAFILRFTCAISWNVYEWRFRTFLDMYIVYIGMILAILTHRISQLKSHTLITSPRSKLDTLLSYTLTRPRTFSLVTTLLSLAILPIFQALISRSPNKADYNWWHPFISPVPILCYITLRNCLPIFRSYNSALFIWLGRISLETYILQYHIWLAGDTTGLLRLGLWNRWFEAGLLTAVFLWTGWKVEGAVGVVVGWVVGGREERAVLVRERGEGLLRLEDGEGTPSKSDRFGGEFGDGGVSRLVGRVRGDLRWRVVLIGVVLWLGNITYR